MNSTIQLISLSISLIYGILFYFITNLNFYLINNINKILKNIITIIYVFNMSFIYAIILYKLNNGYFHIYFILMVIFGYYIGYLLNNNIKSKIHVNIKINKLK